MPETSFPQGPPNGGPMAPWAELGVQLIDALLQRLNGDGRSAPPRGPPADGEKPARRSDDRLERVCRLLSRRNERVASALGACRCWGLSPDCPRCSGQGRPGALDVDPDAFVEVVLPLIEAQPELLLRHLTRATNVASEQ